MHEGNVDPDLLNDLKEEAAHYVGSITTHMEREENGLWRLMDQHYTPPEQGAIMGKIGAFFKPEQLIQVVPWIINNLDDANWQEGYVQLIKIAFPEPVFEMVKGWIKEGISDEVWSGIATVLVVNFTPSTFERRI